MISDDKYIEFFLKAPSRVVRLECLEFSHSNFSRTYYIVRNATDGITVTYEDGQSHFHEYYPLKIQFLGVHTDLESGIHVDLGDLGELIPREIMAVMAAGGMLTKPQVIYRAFRSDILTAPMGGPLRLEIKTVSRNREGCSFDAAAVSLNLNTTGEVFDMTRFYSLRGFLYQ